MYNHFTKKKKKGLFVLAMTETDGRGQWQSVRERVSQPRLPEVQYVLKLFTVTSRIHCIQIELQNRQ